METGGAWVLVAADGVGPESEALATEDDSDPLLSVAQDSQEPGEVIVVLAADGMVPDSQEVAADGVALDSQEPDEGITPELPDSMEVVPDSLPPRAFVCGRCGLVHEDREAWNHAHSRFHPCPSCGLIHADYSISAMLGRIKVDCEIFMEQYKGLLSNDANASVRSMF
ncbi:hypothetical protein PVAP13_3KG430003 [Panicum virgatum]|uniref:Uncharacterized protein n=1 Tax=Panicum virgatum TaxID=38727 RepID=A0A8T0V7X5_PANVG|nr:hypothetical protein PVAP13_3KG430003 [Panicum virgatum]